MNLKDLQKKWYQKLEDEGFDDIEKSFQYHSTYFRDRAPKLIPEKEVYFHRASAFLEDFEFDSTQDRRIWEMHTAGATIRKIAKELGLSVGSIHATVARLKAIMLEAIL